MTPSTSVSRATTSGVPPSFAIRSTAGASAVGTTPPCSSTHVVTASAAPLRSAVPPESMPLMRVSAVNGTKRAPGSPSSAGPSDSASSTIERPSGVSSASDESRAALTSCAMSTAGIGTNSAAWRLP